MFKEALHLLSDLLMINNASGDSIPYLSYVEMTVELPGLGTGKYSLLVVPDTVYNMSVPLLVGTNILGRLKDELLDKQGVWFLQKAETPGAIIMGLQAMCVAQRRLDKAHGVVDKVRMANQVELAPGEVKEVLGRVQLAVSMASQTTTMDALGSFVDGNVTVTPALTWIGQDMEMIVVELCNHSGQPATIRGNTVVAQLSQAHVLDVDAVERLLPYDEEFIDTFEAGHLSLVVAMELGNFLMESNDDFTWHKLDLGHTKVKRHQIKMKDKIPWKTKHVGWSPPYMMKSDSILRKLLVGSSPWVSRGGECGSDCFRSWGRKWRRWKE